MAKSNKNKKKQAQANSNKKTGTDKFVVKNPKTKPGVRKSQGR